MKLLLLAALVAATLAEKYTVTVSTKNVKHANSNGYFYALALDYTGKSIDFGLMDDPKRNDFERGRTDHFVFNSKVEFGKIGCLVLWAGNKSQDAWMPDKVSITSDKDPKGFSGENAGNKWLSSDTSEGELAMMWCAPPPPKPELQERREGTWMTVYGKKYWIAGLGQE